MHILIKRNLDVYVHNNKNEQEHSKGMPSADFAKFLHKIGEGHCSMDFYGNVTKTLLKNQGYCPGHAEI